MSCLLVAGVSDQLVLVNFIARASDLVECFEEAVRCVLFSLTPARRRSSRRLTLARAGRASYATCRTRSPSACSLPASASARSSRRRARPSRRASSATSLAVRPSLSLHELARASLTLSLPHLRAVYVAASRAKEGSEDSAPAFIARFYKAVLHAICPAGAPPTRPPSPRSSAQQGMGALGVNPFEQLDGLTSEIFTGLDSLVADLNRDNTYWCVPSCSRLHVTSPIEC